MSSLLRKYMLSFVAIMIAATMISGSSLGAGLWSTELWSEDAGDQPAANNGYTGLWSEGLLNPSPQPTQPTVPLEPGLKPTIPLKPPTTEPVLPIPQPPKDPDTSNGQQAKPDEDIIVAMQIGNTDAIVRGVETEMLVPPFNINGRVMIPLGFIGEVFDVTFTWNGVLQKVTMTKGDKTAQLWIGETTVYVNEQSIEIDFPPMVLNGTTLVPARFLSEQWGYIVTYDQTTQWITISESEMGETQPLPQGSGTETDASIAEPISDSTATVPEEQPLSPVTTGDDEFDYFGVWELRLEGFDKGVLSGTLVVNRDGTYGMSHGANGDAIGTWRKGKDNEVIGYKDTLILENGPSGVDWVMVPKEKGLVSIRYQWGETNGIKIWFVANLGIKVSR